MFIILILLFGVFACSTSVLFIKLSATDPILLSAYRLLLGGLLLAPLAWRARRRHGDALNGRWWRGILPPALLLALHFISWIAGARLTPVAHSTLIVNMVPAVMPLLLVLGLREHPNRSEWVGTALAMLGVLLLGLSDYHFSPAHALGDAVCFVSMFFYAAYLVFGRVNRMIPSIYLYVVPVYLVSGLICLLLALPAAGLGLLGPALGPDRWLELGCIAGLALLPTVLGHSILNWAMQRLRGQTVAVLNLAQFVFAGLLGYWLLAETPAALFFPSAMLVVGGALVVIRAHAAAR
jgi:drug/metabolite transporter (DMT)-like permease